MHDREYYAYYHLKNLLGQHTTRLETTTLTAASLHRWLFQQ